MRRGMAGAALAAAGVLWAGDIAAGAGAAWAAAAPAEGLRIGVVDMQKVITDSTKGQRARAQLQTEMEAKRKEIGAREEEVRKLQVELERQRSVLSPAALRDKEEVIQRKVREGRRVTEDAERDIQKREAELVSEIQREVLQVVAEYGRERGFSLLLERSAGVWYVSDRVDVTKEIIDRYNARGK